MVIIKSFEFFLLFTDFITVLYCNQFAPVPALFKALCSLTLTAPITTAADNIYKYFFIVFQRKQDMIFHVNPLLGRGFT